MEITADNALDAWKKAMKEILENGQETSDFEGRLSRELLNLTITVRCVDGITAPMEKIKGLKKWVYPELDEIEDVIFKRESSSAYYYTYGVRLFNYSNSKDQIEDYIIPLLKEHPNSRRAIAVLYHPLIDSKLIAKESPCMISIYFKILDGKLTVTTLLRSNDVFIGWPANIYHSFLLQRHVAGKLGIEAGSITTISHSGHVFDEYNEEMNEILRK
jgi:thymidylate synthase